MVVLPAGTGHRNAGSDADLLVVGAYPNAIRWDIRRSDPDERAEVLANIARVPLSTRTPCWGAADRWSSCGVGWTEVYLVPIGRMPRRDKRDHETQPTRQQSGATSSHHD